MDHALFWQTVGAVYLGCLLFAITAFVTWKHGRFEKGEGPRPGALAYFAAAAGPLCVAAAAFMLP